MLRTRVALGRTAALALRAHRRLAPRARYRSRLFLDWFSDWFGMISVIGNTIPWFGKDFMVAFVFEVEKGVYGRPSIASYFFV